MKDVWDELWGRKFQGRIHDELIGVVARNVTAGGKLLEVGFGTGEDLMALGKLGYEVHGIDRSGIAVAKFKRKLGKELIQNRCQVFKGHAEELHFADSSFDCVYHQGVMEHFKTTGRFLYEQWRVIKPDGILVVDVPNARSFWGVKRWLGLRLGVWPFGWERGYTRNQLVERLSNQGFEVVNYGYREIWPPRLSKLLGIYPISNRLLKDLLDRKFIRVLGGWLSDILGDFKYSSVYVVARKKSYFADIAMDGRVFEGGNGGMSAYALNVIRRLPQFKFWLLYQQDVTMDLPKNTVAVRMSKASKWWSDQIVIPSVLKRLGVGVYFEPANMGVPIWFSGKVLLTVHDVIPAYWSDYFSESRIPVLSKLIYRLRLQLGLLKAFSVTTDSPMSKDDLSKCFWVNENKVKVVPLGVPEEDLKFTNHDLKTLKKYGLERRKYILNHGGIDRRKNIEFLIGAFSQFISYRSGMLKDLKLVIAGEDTSVLVNLKLETESLRLGKRVLFVGKVTYDEMQILVRNARLVVYPTLAEGFGLPLLEALGAGVPVVASNLPVFKWMAGNVPYFVDPLSVNSISSGIKKAFEDRDNSHRVSRGKQMARRFTWENVSAGVGEALMRLT